MAQVGGGRWRRWLYLYLPLGLFVIVTLFPFYYMAVTAIRPDREMYIPWNRPHFAPFWTLKPTLEHFALQWWCSSLWHMVHLRAYSNRSSTTRRK